MKFLLHKLVRTRGVYKDLRGGVKFKCSERIALRYHDT